jgi:predicted nuclease of predicted toxin-antitoxin system
MPSLYSNENLSIDLVERIREFGYDVLTSYQAEQANQATSDDEVLAYATANQRSVITFNRDDFVALHHSGVDHAEIIVCEDDRDYLQQAQALHAFLATQTDSLQNRLVRVLRQNQPGSIQKLFVVKEYLR